MEKFLVSMEMIFLDWTQFYYFDRYWLHHDFGSLLRNKMSELLVQEPEFSSAFTVHRLVSGSEGWISAGGELDNEWHLWNN